MKTTAANVAGRQRIQSAREQLHIRNFRCLSSGEFGLPSYDRIEVWVRSGDGLTVYMVIDEESGGFDILVPVTRQNSIDATWAAVDKL